MIVPFPSDPHVLPYATAALELLAKYPSLVLYVGPDQIMPLTSMLGAIAGMALIFWNKIVDLARRSLAFFSRRSPKAPKQAAD